MGWRDLSGQRRGGGLSHLLRQTCDGFLTAIALAADVLFWLCVLSLSIIPSGFSGLPPINRPPSTRYVSQSVGYFQGLF